MFNKIDFDAMYTNALTATMLQGTRIPVMMDSPGHSGAVKTCDVADSSKIRMVRIANTLHIEEILTSETMLDGIEPA